MIDPIHAGAVLHVDLDAVVANWRSIGRSADPAAAGAVVKADAYGLGALPVSGALAEAGCRHFFVAHFSEALELSGKLPPDAKLYVLNGLMPGSEVACHEAGAVPFLNSLDQLDRWSSLARSSGQRLPAVLQVDSGMARFGLAQDELLQLTAERQRLEGIELLFIASHLACASERDHPANATQLARFRAICDDFPGIARMLDNSAAALTDGGRPHFDLVRPGIGLYGANPFEELPNPMRPVVHLVARIAQLRWIPAGTGVGYGHDFTATRHSRLATVPVGYGDGWPRSLSGRGAVFIGGVRAPVVGRISMDSMIVDVTDIDPEALFPGAPVELIGPHQSLDDVARDAGTIAYEILTGLGRRYARSYHSAVAAVHHQAGSC